MNYDEIKKVCYEQFGSFSHLAFEVLLQAHDYSNLHDLCLNTGVSYKFVRDIMALFTDFNGDEYDVKKILDLNLVDYQYQEIDFNQFVDKLTTILTQFQTHNRNLDHISADVATVIKRAQFIYEHNDVENLNILFLGDHDFSSIGLAYILKQYNKKFNICVADIDENVLNFITDVSFEYNLGIKVLHSDFRIGVPKIYEGQFDLIFSDPPYTPEGMALFLKQAIVCARNKFSSVYLCYKTAELVPSIGLKVQKELLKCQVYIRELISNFNSYYGAEALGYRSDLIICSLTPKALEEQTISNSYNIYTHGLNSIEAEDKKYVFQYKNVIEFLSNQYNYSTNNIKIITNNKKMAGSNGLDVTTFYKQQRNKNSNYPKDSVFVFDFTYQSIDTMNLRMLLMTAKNIQFAIFSYSQLETLSNKQFDSILSLFNVQKVYHNDEYIILKLELKDDVTNSLKSIMIYKYSNIKNAYVNIATKSGAITKNQARNQFAQFKFADYGDAYIFDLPLHILNLISATFS